MTERIPLTRQRIVDAAVAVADRGGVTALSMRNVGRELGVEAMSLYHHIANKDELLDAVVDEIFARITLPAPDDAWREGMVRRARSARDVLTTHPWALHLVDSRSHPGPALLRSYDAVLGCLRRGGFSPRLSAHAFSVIDAYVYGFALTVNNLPFDAADAEGPVDVAETAGALMAPYPHLHELVTELTSGDEPFVFADEFDYGLDVVLDALERRL